jgi:hypothetical protein
MLTWIALTFLAAAAILLLIHRRQRELGGLPSGELVYSDVAAQDVPVLISLRYGLKGKPDALVRIPSGEVIPVERKKSRAPKRPYESDLIQAIAYCVLVEENCGRTPPFMRIQYADACFDEPILQNEKSGFAARVKRSGRPGSSGLLTALTQCLQSAAPAVRGKIAIRLFSED